MNNNEDNLILFLDDWFIQRRENLHRKIGRPKLISDGIYVDPVLDVSWGYPTVFEEKKTGVWRCLYQGQLDKKHTPSGRRMQHIPAILESEDGVEWEAPDLSKNDDTPDRICKHQVLPQKGFGEWGPCFYDEHTSDPNQRIKAFVSSFGQMNHSPLYVSPDGISWELVEDASWHPYGIDPAVSAFWNSIQNKYTISARPKHGDRRISIYQTNDWKTFTEPHVAVRTDAQDYPASEVYGMPVFPYFNMYIGLLWIYQTSQIINSPHKFFHGKVTCQLAYSYNGLHFQRSLRKEFLPLAEPGEFGYGCIYPSSMHVTKDKKIRIYSSASKGEHAQILARPDQGEGAILLHELRLDGFCYLESHGGPGSFTTRLLLINGEKLNLNIQAPQGEVLLQISDPSGKPFEGFTFNDFIPIKGDDIDLIPEWKNKRTLKDLIQKVVRFDVKVFNSRIYSIRGNFLPIQGHEFRIFTETGKHPDKIYEL